MTDEVFEDLVNLYLDKEISPAQLNILRDELGRNPSRQKTFESYCRMHQASHFAALSACPVVPRLSSSDNNPSRNKPGFFALNNQVVAAAILITLIGSFATLYFNGPFGSARITQSPNRGIEFAKIETFSPVPATDDQVQPPLEFFRSLQARESGHDWVYVQELRHARAASNFHSSDQPAPSSWNSIIPEEVAGQTDPAGFEIDFSSYEFRK